MSQCQTTAYFCVADEHCCRRDFRSALRRYHMSKRSKSPSTAAPLTFDLPLELIDKIEVARRALDLSSASEVVRTAIARFDFAKCRPEHIPHRQISVRLSGEHRATLKRQARLKDVSVGELLRLALEALPNKKVARKKR
jgi:Arc/MetJ-type ribon-helix-helix transcriptional regulator